MRVHLLDGTYELFRQFFGQPPRASDDGTEIGATYGVVTSVLGMLAGGGHPPRSGDGPRHRIVPQ